MEWLPRYKVLGILCVTYMLCYLDRMVIASAIPFIARDLHLSHVTSGEVLSAFFVGYALMQIPGGVLADRIGHRVILTGSIAWWSIMTALSGVASSVVQLFITRGLFGLGEGPFPSAASKALSIWFPSRELGRASGLLQTAASIGAAIAPLIVTALVLKWGWRVVFYCISFPGAALALMVWTFVTNSPPLDPGGVEQKPSERASPCEGELRQTLKNPCVLWCAICLFFANIVAWGLLSWLPTYLLQAREFSVELTGLFTAMTNLSGALGYAFGGYICDRYFSQSMRTPIVIGLLVSAIFTYLAAIAPTGELAVACFVSVYFFSNIAFTAIFTLAIVIVPRRQAGSSFGIVNTAGQLSGVLAPAMVGYLLSATHDNFVVVLYSLMGLTFVALYPATRIRQDAHAEAAR